MTRDGGVNTRRRDFGCGCGRYRCTRRCITARRHVTIATVADDAAAVVVVLAVVNLGRATGTDRRRRVRGLAGDRCLGGDGGILTVALQILHEFSHTSTYIQRKA